MAALRTSPRARRTLTTVTAAGCLLLGTAAAANAAPKADLSPPKVLSAENSRGEAADIAVRDDGSAVAERIIAGDALPDAGMGGPPSGMQGGPSGPSGSTGQSGTMTPPSEGGADSSGTSGAPGTTGGAPGADAGPSGVTTT